jgi:hypothetical protein
VQLQDRVEPLVGQLQTVPDRLVQVAQESATRFQRAASTN